jgi:hypothetical protein
MKTVKLDSRAELEYNKYLKNTSPVQKKKDFFASRRSQIIITEKNIHLPKSAIMRNSSLLQNGSAKI